MSTTPSKPISTTGTTTSTTRTTYGTKAKAAPERYFLFDKQNYMLMIGGVALIFIGFLLMSGGKSANPHEFHYDEIYSFRRITLAPIVVLLGFGVNAYAIMKKPKDTSNTAA